MKHLKVSENFVPISEFKAQAAEWLRRADESNAPVVVTQNGRPAGVLLSPAAFDQLTDRARVVAAIEEGLADEAAGRVHSHADLVKELKARVRARR
jgi:prevent-host-death family protein